MTIQIYEQEHSKHIAPCIFNSGNDFYFSPPDYSILYCLVSPDEVRGASITSRIGLCGKILYWTKICKIITKITKNQKFYTSTHKTLKTKIKNHPKFVRSMKWTDPVDSPTPTMDEST